MLKFANQVKQTVGSTTFELKAEANESFRVKAIRIDQTTTDYVTVRVNRETVAYLRVDGTQGSHTYFPTGTLHKPALYEKLIEEGVFDPIPVPTGYTLTITGLDSDSVVQVLYDEYEANDVSSTERNGPDSNSYDYISYGRYSTTLAAGENKLVTTQTTTEYPDFPFGDIVPAKSRIVCHGIAFSGIGKSTSSQANQQRTNYLKLVKEKKTLFDKDLNGLLYRGNVSTTADVTNVGSGEDRAGNNSSADQKDYLMFDPPRVFDSGEELEVFLDTTVVTGSANIAAADAEVAFILSLERI